MTNYIGMIMLSLPFIALFWFLAKDSLRLAFGVFAASAATTYYINVAVNLINEVK